MPIRIVRLGSTRAADEGVRIGTVRRPPRGVPKAEFARRDYYDTWLPTLAPSAQALQQAQAATTPAHWRSFERRYRAEMKAPGAANAIALLAALSAQANFSVGCYCEDETRCHRRLLRTLLAEAGARIVEG